MSDVYIRHEWTCPHCGQEQTIISDIEPIVHIQPQLVYCDLEQGGCDEMVVLKVQLAPVVKVYKVTEVPQ